MKPNLSACGAILRRLSFLLLLFFWPSGAVAQEAKDYPLGPIGGSYRVTANSSLIKISALTSGEPGVVAGLQVGDFIYGAFGQTFTPTGNYHYGVTQELGIAVDRAEAGDGVLPLLVVRPGSGGMTINVALPAAGAFGAAYPRNSAKYAAVYENAVAYLHTRVMNANGNVDYPTGWIGLILLGHPNWNDTTGAKPYRLSINKVRDRAILLINFWNYASVDWLLPDGSVNPNPHGNASSNWQLGQLVMFLSEYYEKTGDSSVAAVLQRGTEMCGNTIQYWNQGNGRTYDQVVGMTGHDGVTSDYGNLWFNGINMPGLYSFNGMAFARRAGMNMDARSKDGHYYGYALNPGDPIPPALANALPSSITLPKYGEDSVLGATINNPFYYDPSVHQKFTMQMDCVARRSAWFVAGHNDDGFVGYAPGSVSSYDAGGRTPATVLGMAMYQQDVGDLDTTDLDRLERMKGYITRNYIRHQEAHAYCVGAQAYQALAAPYLSDRQQRFFMDNWRFFFALSRTSTNDFRYFPARSVADNSQNYTDCAAIDYALPYGIANGRYNLIPGYNTNRTLANFKSPVLMWPSLAARTATVISSSQAFQIDVCDGNGNVLAPANYTATWAHVSGPATATFSPGNAAKTTITFPTVSTTPYRVRLTISRAGVPDLVEDIDITRANSLAPVAPTIIQQPFAQSTPPGGGASFSVTVAGTGPFVYQWRLNGAAYWGSSTSPTLNLTNVSSGHVGSYDCVIYSPTGTLISSAAPLTLSAILSRVTGGLRREVWTGLAGGAITDLTGQLNYPLFPAISSVTNSAEGPLYYSDYYGQKLSGWIKPPVSGTYKFFLSSDDASELWLSTDDTAANKVRIINHPSASGYRSYDLSSAVISLVAGQKYYIEILHKEFTGGDHVSVAWQMPGEATPTSGAAPISGVYLEADQYLPLLTNHWKLDEASGSNCTDSVGTSPATLFNNPTRVTGISGNAVTFNGVNQYAKATVNVSETVSGVSLWFRTTQSGGGLYSVIDEATGADRTIYLNAGNIRSYIWNTETISSTGRNYADGQWHHVVLTFGGAIGGQKLYVDGEQVAAGAMSRSDFTTQTAIKIGYAFNAPSPYFNGTIDDVRIYNAGLSEQNAIALHDAALNAAPQVQAATFAVNENVAIGTTVGSVTATDANAGQTLAYSIVGGNVGNRFAINSASGAITVNGLLDFENISSYLLNVRVTDNGASPSSGEAIVTVNVTNINDAPVFASNPIHGPSTPAGLPCSGHITATDSDFGDSVTITKTSGAAWLSIAANGTLSGTPAVGNLGLNTFVVRVSDSSSAWSEATLEILVVDLAVHPMWSNPAGGSWPVAGNWLSGTVANGLSSIADFTAPDLTANATVTLDGSRTIGGLFFGDTDNQFGWTLSAGTGGTLTLNATGNPAVEVLNQTATLGLPIAGTKGLAKTGTGLLALTAANTYTGTTAVNVGTLRIGNGTTVGSLNTTSPVAIAANATAIWNHNAGITIPNSISGSGQWVLQGTNSITALHQSTHTPTGSNSSFTGELILNRSMAWGITNGSQVGGGTIRIQDCATLAVTGGATIANTIKIEDGAGWHHNIGGNDAVIGAIRMEGTNTFTGNLQLNHNTGVIPGDNTGNYSTFGSYSTANNTFSGVISGSGEFSMSRYTSGGGGQINIDLAGTASNTFTGKTVVDGQNGISSLRLMKTGGAIAIPGGNTVQLGSYTSGQANLRMGDVVATGTARNQWDNQFGTNNGGVVLNFINSSGNWMRFDLQGSRQSVAGLNAGSEFTPGGGIVQNQNLQAFNPGQDATLTLIGSDAYLYNGYLRDQDNGGTTRKLHLVKAGTGVQTLAGTALTYTGTITVNSGTLRIRGTLGNTVMTINSGGRVDGSGTLNGPLTLNAGATLTAGNDSTGTLTFTNSVSLHNSGTVALRIHKSGSLLSNDRVALTGASGLVCKGTLTVTLMPDSASLAVGDTFTLLSATAGLSGNFATVSLPTLPPALQWDTENLGLDGSIKVIPIEQVVAPVFSPGSGSYVGVQSVTISTTTLGATIRYTTDGTDPITSATAISGPAPVSGVTIPAPANVTLNAYAFKAGAFDSPVASASYGTVMPDGITWTNPSGGSWATSTNWLNGVIANASGRVAKFDTLSLTGNATVSLNGATTAGGITFADTGNQYSWTLAPGSGGALTLAGSGTPVLTVTNQPALISAVLAGSQGWAKSGPGTLTLTGANTYTGITTVSGGTLQLGDGTIQPTINSTYDINAGTSLRIRYNTATGSAVQTWSKYTGAGTLALATGKNYDSGWGQAGLGASFTGTLQIEGGRTYTGAAGVGLGGTTQVVVKNGGQFGTWNGGNFSQNFTITGTGYGEVNFEAALRLANTGSTNTLSGTVTLAGDATIGAYGTGIATLNNPIDQSLASNLTVGTAGLNGTVVFQGVNTYTGNTIVRNGVLSLNAAAPTVLGNLQMIGGDGTYVRTQQANQFASGVIANFTSASGAWNRLEFFGKDQTFAGINTGTTTTQGGGVIQNSEANGAAGANATLTLNGTGTYVFNGILRDWGSTSAGNHKISLIKNGAGIQTLAGGVITYTGATTVNGGTLKLQAATGFASATTVGSGAILELAGSANNDQTAWTGNALTLNGGSTLDKTNTGWNTFNAGNVVINGSAAINIANNGSNNQLFIGGSGSGLTGTGTINLTNTGTSTTGLTLRTGMNPAHFNGAMIVSGGVVNIGSGAGTVLDNTNLTINSSAILNLNGAYGATASPASVKSLASDSTGSVVLGAQALTIGTNNGGANFAGVISGTGAVAKAGTGTQTLSGINTYTGTTTVSGGTLRVNGSLANTTTTVATAGTLGGTGTINGTMTVNGTLAPGVGGIGTLTSTKTLTLAGITSMEVSKVGTTLTADKISGVTTVTYGGTLIVTNVGPDALMAGNSFRLFSATTYNGSFGTLTLPALGTGLSWNTNRLTVDGTISVQGSVPAGWNSADIGSVGVPGGSNYAAGTYTVSGSGSAIGGTADAFQSVSQTLAGNGEIRARITSQTNTNAAALAGIMLRDGSAANSANVFLGLTPVNGFVFQARATSGGNTTQLGTATSNVTPNNWVRITRSGTLITAYVSADGSSWTKVASTTLAMTSASAHLAVTSHDNAVTSTATFDNVAVTPFPSPWQTEDIGSVGYVGKAEYYDSVFTVTGSGADIYYSNDAFRFLRQPLSGDGSIIARVTGVQAANIYSKAGIMIRESLISNSSNAMLTIIPGGSAYFQTRTTTAGATGATYGAGATGPRWLKLTRVGNIFTAYHSGTGAPGDWVQVGTATTISMTSEIYIGLGVSAHDNTKTCDATFDNITVTP
jgi:autotransporter-associated beta strand protein